MDRPALVAFLRARLEGAPDVDSAGALLAVVQLAEDAFSDDEEWSLVPDPIARRGSRRPQAGADALTGTGPSAGGGGERQRPRRPVRA
ncbi:hypothetical protein AB0I28_35830 [Phytomonospora sp. NPDC050363]|uniref:hypothetical protein n=1 Tax=Phytomonospora sp. NPDC050363 TaxID=3155642 RepID=UPI0033FE7836